MWLRDRRVPVTRAGDAGVAWRREANINLSREARLFCGVMLLTVPTIMYGGATLLGILKRGGACVSSGLALDETQWALFRAATRTLACG
jgi:hypothetical protein